jgi:hypothetical protein
MPSTWLRSYQSLLRAYVCGVRNIWIGKDIPCLGVEVCLGFHQVSFSFWLLLGR